jgi:drug/metabolite transporter (DMT)-like permease
MKQKYVFTNNLIAVLLGIFGAILFSSKAILVKLTYRIEPIDATTMLTLRLLFALPFYLTSLALQSRKDAILLKSKDWFWLIFMGLVGFYASAWLDFAGLKYVPAAIERLILFIYPSIVLLVTAVVFKQKINRYQYIALLLTYFGIALAVGEEARRSSTNITPLSNSDFWKGSLLVFGCALTYSLYILIGGRIIQRLGAIRVTNWAMIFATIGIFIHFLLYYEIKYLFRFSNHLYFTILIMSFLATVLPSYLLSWSIRQIGADNAAIINCVGPVSTLLQAFFFLGEPITIVQLLGTIFVLWGVLLIGNHKK